MCDSVRLLFFFFHFAHLDRPHRVGRGWRPVTRSLPVRPRPSARQARHTSAVSSYPEECTTSLYRDASLYRAHGESSLGV